MPLKCNVGITHAHGTCSKLVLLHEVHVTGADCIKKYLNLTIDSQSEEKPIRIARILQQTTDGSCSKLRNSSFIWVVLNTLMIDTFWRSSQPRNKLYHIMIMIMTCWIIALSSLSKVSLRNVEIFWNILGLVYPHISPGQDFYSTAN